MDFDDLQEEMLENYLVKKHKCFTVGCRVKHLEDDQDEGTVVGILEDPDNKDSAYVYVYWDNENAVGRHEIAYLYLYTNGKTVAPTATPEPKLEKGLEYLQGFHDGIKAVMGK